MRIGVYTEIYKPVLNGVVVSVESFREQLEALGHEVYIFTPSFMGYSDARVLPFHSLPLPATQYRFTLPIRADGRSPQLDVIHAQSPFATGLLAWQHAHRDGIPLVFTYHTRLEDYSHYVPAPRPLSRRWLVWVSRTFSNMADWVIVPSTPIKNLLEGYGVTVPIDVVPTRVRLAATDAAAGIAIRARHGIHDDVPVLLNVGRLAEEKNVALLLEAFARTHGSHLLLVGDGPLRGRLQERAQTLGIEDRVSFAGFIEHRSIAPYYAAADLFVFTSLTETQGLVLDEALQMGVPVLAIAQGGVLDALQRGVGTRAVAFVEDSEVLCGHYTAALQAILEEPGTLARLSAEARSEADAPSDAVQRLVSIYQAAVLRNEMHAARKLKALNRLEAWLGRRP